MSSIKLNFNVLMDQVHAVSAKMTEQKRVFYALGIGEQTRIRTDFESPAGAAEGTWPYKDFLQSEALGRRFQELHKKSIYCGYGCYCHNKSDD